MIYSNEEINKFIEILKSSNKPKKPQSNKVVCNNCQTRNFIIQSGQYVCEDRGLCQGHVLGYHDKSEYERFHFRKKSIYQRKYHYQNKINEVCNRFELVLPEDEKYQLYVKLMEIDNSIIKKINQKLKTNRLINIYFLIQKMLKLLHNKQYKKLS